MKIIGKRGLSILLSLLMLATLLPGLALAAEEYTVSLSASAAEVNAGESISIDVDVTSGTQSSYNSFYAILSYDSSKFTYSGESAVDSFNIDSATAGTLKISRAGESIAISASPDLTLNFKAVAGGTCSFALTSAKVDEAANAEQDAQAAATGEPIRVSVTSASGYSLAFDPSTDYARSGNNFSVAIILTGGSNRELAPSNVQLSFSYAGATFIQGTLTDSLGDGTVSVDEDTRLCSVTYSNPGYAMFRNGSVTLATVNFTMGESDTGAVLTAKSAKTGNASIKLPDAMTVASTRPEYSLNLEYPASSKAGERFSLNVYLTGGTPGAKIPTEIKVDMEIPYSTNSISGSLIEYSPLSDGSTYDSSSYLDWNSGYIGLYYRKLDGHFDENGRYLLFTQVIVCQLGSSNGDFTIREASVYGEPMVAAGTTYPIIISGEIELPTLRLGEGSAPRGGTVDIPLYYDRMETDILEGIGASIYLDCGGLTLEGVSAAEGSELRYSTVETGRMGFYLKRANINDGLIAYLTFRVPEDASSGDVFHPAFNESATNAQAKRYVSGVVTVTEGVMVKFETPVIAVVKTDGVERAYESISAGSSLSFTVTPRYTDVEIYEVSVGGESLSASGGCYTLENIQDDITVTITAGWSERVADLEIGTAEEMKAFADRVNRGETFEGRLVCLTADIDLSEYSDWDPIGGYKYIDGTPMTMSFCGVFDGDGHRVTLAIDHNHEISDGMTGEEQYSEGKRDEVGLFGRIENAQLRNLITDGTLRVSDATYAAPICAYALDSDILYCENYADIYPLRLGNAAGIAAAMVRLDNDTDHIGLYHCLNAGNMLMNTTEYNTAISRFGGVTASAAGVVMECGNFGDFTAISTAHSSTASGGYLMNACEQIAGVAVGASKVTACFNKGSIIATAREVYGVTTIDGLITDCYNTGSLSSDMNGRKGENLLIGGVGNGLCVNCYSTGTVKVLDTGSGYAFTGAIVPGNCIYAPKNCYTLEDAFEAVDLGAAYKTDLNGINGGYPLLYWQDTEAADTEYPVTFDVSPVNASVTVYSDAEHKQVIPAVNGAYSLKMGTYFYNASAAGCMEENGSFSITFAGKTVAVTLLQYSTVSFRLTPANAEFVLSDNGGNPVTADSVQNGAYSFRLYNGYTYSYTATADGYNSTTREITVAGNAAIDVTLTESSQGQVEESRVIKPDNAPYTISEGGSYDLESGDFGSGYVYINTTEPITIIGSGVAASSMSEDLHVVCQTSGVNLTLQDVYISNVDGKANMINFQGSGNTLAFAGTSILDQDSNAAGYAMIHVPDSAQLTVTGGTVYLYKREQGAGIGGNGGAGGGEGQIAETNGTINIVDATIFGKNSKQGALIGAGAQAGSQRPGDITIEDSTLYLIAISRGGAIGGSAGSGGASSGTNVTVSNSQITINVDWSGSAIGGGGYDGGNDSDGGTLVYESGSVRTFIDENALSSWTVSEAGVNGNKAITARVENSNGAPLYLLVFNTGSLGGNSFTVREENKMIYAGGLHGYAYVNEALEKDNQIDVTYTIDNWTSLDDPNLYLYLTGEDHTLDVNGKTFTATWNADSQTFTVKDESGKTVEPSGETTPTPTKTDTEVNATTTVSGDTATVTVNDSDLTKAAENADNNTQLVVSAGIPENSNVNTVTTTLPAEGVRAAAEAGASVKAESPVGDVVLSNTALKDLTSNSGEIKVTVTENDDGSTSVAVSVAGLEVNEISGGIKVAIPAKSGSVAALVKEDGTTELIKKSVVENGKAYILLDGSAKVEIVDNVKKFNDVPDNAWYKGAVDFVSSHGLFIGVSETEFGPSLNMTRAMMATVLYRLEGERQISGGTAFKDVDAGTWYSDAVKWANDAGIVLGYDETTFGTNDNITREQMAVMFCRYAKYAGMDVSASKTLDGFTDGSKTSDWAQDAMKWAAAVGLFKGDDTGALRPQDNATRAAVATLYMRMAELMVK